MKVLTLTGWLVVVTGGVVVCGALALGGRYCVQAKRKVTVERGQVKFEMPREKVKKVVLENGMKVVVFESKNVPKVLVQVAYDVGSAAEQDGERGLAHLLEHMIFKGTDKLKEGDVTAIGRKYGAEFNAFTSYDVTSYYFEINKNNWKPFLGILADCMQNARFNDQHLASEMKAVIQEMRGIQDRYTRRMLNMALENLFPSNHPYHHTVIGYKEDLVEVNSKKLSNFYHKYYQPNKATLYIVGDVNMDEALALAQQTFSKIPVTATVAPTVFPHGDGAIETKSTCLFEDVNKEIQGFVWRIPGLEAHNDVLTNVVEGVLGGGEGSILHRVLVDEEKVATEVGVGALQLKQGGIFLIFLMPKDGCREKCRQIVERELQKVVEKGVESADLLKVVRARERDFFGMLQRPQALVQEWINSLSVDEDEFAIFKKVEAMNQIDSSKVQKFVADYLDPFIISEMNVLPLPENKKKVWTEKKQQAEQMDFQILSKHERTAPLEDPVFVNALPQPNPLDFSFPKPDREFTLANGLKVILQKSSYVPLIYVSCRFKDASYWGLSKEGMSLNVMMNLLMEGSEGATKQENVEFFELSGAGYDFGVSGATLSMLNVDYVPVMQRMFDVLTKPNFANDGLEKLRAIVLDSIEHTKDSPRELAKRTLCTMVYKDHPFGWSFDEATELVKKLSIKDVETLHKRFVSPANMKLVISGDMDLDQMQKDIELVFGSWKGGEAQPISVAAGAFTPNEQKDVSLLRDQVYLLLGKSSPIMVGHPDRVPLTLLNFICFGSLGSRIFELREQSGMFYWAGGSWAAEATKVPGYDCVAAMLGGDKAGEAEQKLKALIDYFGANGVKQSELDDARQWYLNTLIDLVTTGGAIAQTLGNLEEFGLGFDYYDKVLKQVQAMSVPELNQFGKKYFTSADLARVRVGRV